jgi:molybdopterin synthase sulfur carrier subunit
VILSGDAGSVSLQLPASLMSLTGGQRRLQISWPEAATVAALLDVIARDYPVLDRRLRSEDGQIRRFVNVYLDDEDLRQLDGIATRVLPGQRVEVIGSVAGG